MPSSPFTLFRSLPKYGLTFNNSHCTSFCNYFNVFILDHRQWKFLVPILSLSECELTIARVEHDSILMAAMLVPRGFLFGAQSLLLTLVWLWLMQTHCWYLLSKFTWTIAFIAVCKVSHKDAQSAVNVIRKYVDWTTQMNMDDFCPMPGMCTAWSLLQNTDTKNAGRHPKGETHWPTAVVSMCRK